MINRRANRPIPKRLSHFIEKEQRSINWEDFRRVAKRRFLSRIKSKPLVEA